MNQFQEFLQKTLDRLCVAYNESSQPSVSRYLAEGIAEIRSQMLHLNELSQAVSAQVKSSPRVEFSEDCFLDIPDTSDYPTTPLRVICEMGKDYLRVVGMASEKSQNTSVTQARPVCASNSSEVLAALEAARKVVDTEFYMGSLQATLMCEPGTHSEEELEQTTALLAAAEDQLIDEDVALMRYFCDAEGYPLTAEALLMRYFPASPEKELHSERDNCMICKGLKGGVKGNENRYGTIVACDYCSADPVIHPLLISAAQAVDNLKKA